MSKPSASRRHVPSDLTRGTSTLRDSPLVGGAEYLACEDLRCKSRYYRTNRFAKCVSWKCRVAPHYSPLVFLNHSIALGACFVPMSSVNAGPVHQSAARCDRLMPDLRIVLRSFTVSRQHPHHAQKMRLACADCNRTLLHHPSFNPENWPGIALNWLECALSPVQNHRIFESLSALTAHGSRFSNLSQI